MASANELLPYMRSGKLPKKDRKFRSNNIMSHMASTLSQSPNMRQHQYKNKVANVDFSLNSHTQQNQQHYQHNKEEMQQ